VEAFLAQQQAVPSEEVLLDLLYKEVMLREQLGERPDPEEYAQRFPALADEMRKQLLLHQALPGDGLPSAPKTVRYGPGGHPAARGWPSVPGYEVLGELGRGGMGVVFKARQVKLDRIVALKMIRTVDLPDPDLRGRFLREAEAIARLQHPNIVQIYEVGEHDGLPFLALEFCPGGSLDKKLNGAPLPPRDATTLLEALAGALHAAHEANVIHRDLKPANVLLDARGTPKVTDFGLARKLDEQGETLTGAVMGTPPYMAPEQAWGKSLVQPLGPAVDVYALGATLYECLTGRPPFRAASPLQTLELVWSQDPLPPTRLNPAVPRDLETICLKCLHKNPTRRYASALELAEDLKRFLAGRPITARPVGRLERTAKWARRQPLAAALLGAVVLVTLGALAALGLAWRAALNEAQARQEAYSAEVRFNRQLEEQLYFSRIALADRELRAGKSAWALHWLELCPAELRHFEWHYLRRLARGQAPARWEGHQRGVSCVAFHPGGKTLASAGFDGTVGLWQVESPRGGAGKLLHRLDGRQGSVNWVCFAPGGQRLASSGADGSVIVWQTSTGKPWKRFPVQDQPIAPLAFHPNGHLLASATYDNKPGEVDLWDVRRARVVGRFRGHTSGITGLAYSADGRLLASSSHDGTVRLLDGRTAREVLAFREHAFVFSAVAFSPDSRLVASTAGRSKAERPGEAEVLIWEASTGKVLHRLKGHAGRSTTLAFSPDGRRLATAGWDLHVKLWDVATGVEVLALTGHRAPVMSVAFSPGGEYLASGGLDRTVRLWGGAD
jgi:tRNA A-37 threonylcarbamoyl transferase component Bud32